jgi:predicted extracellular nuclease
MVSVSGVVEEYKHPKACGELTVTRIKALDIKILSSGNKLPLPVIIGKKGRKVPASVIDDDRMLVFDPENDAIDFYESLEGMRVRLYNPVATGPSNRKCSEAALLPDGGEETPNRTPNGGVCLVASSYNPHIISVSAKYIKRYLPPSKTGDYFKGSLSGIMGYEYGNYRIYITSPFPKFVKSRIIRGKSPFSTENGRLTVASYNIENCSVEDLKHINRIGTDIVNNLNSPDIICLQEVQDNNGTRGGRYNRVLRASKTFRAIIDAIKDAGGPLYGWTDISPDYPGADGGLPGGNIRVGFIYRKDRVGFLIRTPGKGALGAKLLFKSGKVSLVSNPSRLGRLNSAFENSRKPIVCEFSFNLQKIFIIGVHLGSRRGDEPVYGVNQPPVFRSVIKRIKQAAVIANFVRAVLLKEPSSKVIVLGDYNEFYFGEPVTALKGAGLYNLTERLDINKRYTYIHNGNSQAIDHIMVSPSLNKRTSGYDVIHINAEYPPEFRSSDHDPVIARFDFN